MRTEPFSKGQSVRWNWGNGTATGTVKKIFTDTVTRDLQGTEVTRNASEDCPACLVEQDDGVEVLKSCSELETA